MTCDSVQAQLTAYADGEVPPELRKEIKAHLVSCAECAGVIAEYSAVREKAAVWTVDTPDLTERILNAVTADEQSLLLDELRALRTEMSALRAEVADLRRRLPRRDDPPAWFPSAKSDFARLENDPWNLTRS